ncbi:hypothetical protein [Ornithinibacillus sp. JPR2-1]|uniref:hypothetical protein n=1 Tax=Ornithinibacillus sp. JPR2-1 TaxID=2094019 RepID=UPI0031D306B6
MSNLVNWAEKELNRLVENGDEMQLEINKDILEIVKVFSEQGHSGFSASYALNLIKRLLDWKPITPLTGEDDEWGESYGSDNTQQNKRCYAVFRENFDNSTAHYLYGKVFSDDGGETWYSSRESNVPVTFPYVVPDKPEYIILNNKESEQHE